MRSIAARGLIVAVVTGAALAGIAAPPAGAAIGDGSPPAGFFGVVPQVPPSSTDLRRMAGTVETERLPIYWFECEPRRGRYDFGTVDAEIAAAAEHGIRLLPFVYGRPDWLGARQATPPLGRFASREWVSFLRALVRRYGPGGEFWENRRRQAPIRRWQVWNEPNFRLYWQPRVSPRGYAKLLRVSARAIRRADPGAKIVLAGIAPVGAGMKTWVFMRRLLRVPGVRREFDFAALHPYSAPGRERDYQRRRVRAAMAAGGAGRKPLIVTEIGVASTGDYPSAFVEGFDGQARFLRQAYRRLLAMRHRWHLAGAYWFTWQDLPKSDPHCSFCQGAGLFDLAGDPKPAWLAYRRLVAAIRLE